MRLLRLAERIYMFDAQLEPAARNHVHYVGSPLLQFGARGNVVKKGGTGKKQRAFLREQDRIEGRHGTASSSKQDQVSTRAQQVEILSECALAYAIINNMNTLTVGKALGFRLEILLRINNHVVCPGIERQLGLLF